VKESPPSSKPARALKLGQQVGRYRIERMLGKGSMGEVYLGVDEQLGRKAAIKTLSEKLLGNETVRERFLREARALAKLTHPNLITVYESGIVDGADRPYFAMELLEGGDTHKLLDERGPLSSDTVSVIGAQAAAGLAEAARAGIIHRDVKPSNLGISARGTLKVTDFSLAKSVAAEKSLTGRGMVVGTADYIAPEQARGEKVDERADVYSLGCTLFHLLTGKPPFRAEEGTEVQKYVEVMRAHLSAPIPDPHRYADNVDPELARIIAKMMDKDREKRPSFDEVAPPLAQVAVRLGGHLPRATRSMPSADNDTVQGLARKAEHTHPPVRIDKLAGRTVDNQRLAMLLGIGIIAGAVLALVAVRILTH